MDVDNVSRRQEKFASLVIFDAEATGLQSTKTRFTEVCFYSVQTHELLSRSTPRAVNKLVLTFNPMCMIGPGTSEITGNLAIRQNKIIADPVSMPVNKGDAYICQISLTKKI